MKLSEKYPDIFAELSEEINSGTSLITFYPFNDDSTI